MNIDNKKFEYFDVPFDMKKFENKIKLFDSVLRELYCLAVNDRVYADLKLEQILYWKNEDDNYNFILDFGNIQKKEDNPIYTYGPPNTYITK